MIHQYIDALVLNLQYISIHTLNHYASMHHSVVPSLQFFWCMVKDNDHPSKYFSSQYLKNQ